MNLTRSSKLAVLMLVAMVVVPASARAQAVAPAPAAPAASPDAPVGSGGVNSSLPEVGQLLEGIDQAMRNEQGKDGEDWSPPIRMAVVFGLLAVLPALIVMMTSFTRIVIVLGFIRRALTTQNVPPNIAIVGLALFLTLFTMAPTLGTINDVAVKPYLEERITFPEAIKRGSGELKGFMVAHTRESDLAMFVDMAEMDPEQVETVSDLPMHVAIPAFAISEFRTAFEMGCLLFIPFLLIDLVTSGVLLSAGMMMLPPAIVSLPFKIILFVLVDGWSVVAQTLVSSFHGGGP